MTIKNKLKIVQDWLPRYTGTALKDFADYILLTNFEHYLHLFSEWYNVPIRGHEKPMPNVTDPDQFWDWQPECRFNHGFAERNYTKSGSLPG